MVDCYSLELAALAASFDLATAGSFSALHLNLRAHVTCVYNCIQLFFISPNTHGAAADVLLVDQVINISRGFNDDRLLILDNIVIASDRNTVRTYRGLVERYRLLFLMEIADFLEIITHLIVWHHDVGHPWDRLESVVDRKVLLVERRGPH